MRVLAAIFERLASLLLAIALVVAPISPAVAQCGSGKTSDETTAASASPCDMPCKDCAPKTTKKSCQGECVCVKTLFGQAPDTAPHLTIAFRTLPHSFVPLRAAAGPPDPPPPRTFLV